MTGTAREADSLDGRPLTSWAAEACPGVLVAPLQLRRLPGGHSNVTYEVTGGDGARFVLRRPPYGPLAPGAHDVGREHRILVALSGSRVPVPRPVASCPDESVLGAPFYLMHWVDGFVVDQPEQVAKVLPDASSRRRAAWELVDTLARLHRLLPEQVGLGDLGPRGSYVERQLDRMSRVWERTATRELPVMKELTDRLRRSRPGERHHGLVHGDFRFGNVILATGGELRAVLDWELCTVGDVLADLGFLVNNWELPADAIPPVWMATPPTRAGGFPSRRDLIERYASRSGADVSNVGWYRAFAYWRMAVIAEGIKRRYASGAFGAAGSAAGAIDPRRLDQRVVDLMELALEQLASPASDT
jgi:aminoglycoside phosphotransferase (APT) family kinase protein